MKNIFVAVLVVVALAPMIALTVYYNKTAPAESVVASVNFDHKPVVKPLKVGAQFNVRACKVIDGYKYSLSLEDGKLIEAHLTSATKPEATAIVIESLNKTTSPPPVITLLRQVGTYWIVDFQLTVEGERVSMTGLLKSKDLLL